ncbi:182 kDa tankyrase-1-binding protein isoform X2 [Eublepharis macularius]|uniref:182 kDa tankyrase-1-binding protein isoform X2 n=1 Tax=Eublepharis macularius TaxID=481883 RepID=A0AA97IYX2_EUBMA|nr:182 kDa tankyrase-1-binding protein isoform X2 [Eublepharis macularius]
MHRARLGRASIGPWISESEFQPGDVMDSKPQSLCSPVPCAATNGRSGAKQLSSSPDTGDARPKPPVKPKPCVLPKPAVPMKPTPVLRQALSEVPSAEKINLLAGPKPYSSGAGNSVKRLSFSLKCPPKEATNGKEVSPPFSFAIKPSADGEGAGSAKQSSVIEGTSGEEYRESSSVRKYSFPFKVKPVPVAAKPERFPGTTVEEILAKIEKPNKEGPESPDRPRLVRSFFSQEGGTAVHLGPKGYTAFRRYSSGGEGGEIQLEAPVYRASHEESRLSRNEEEATSSNDQHVPGSGQPATATERDLSFHSRDSSSPPSMSCDGGQPGLRSPPSPPGVSVPQASQPLAKLSSGVTPGSPQAPAEPAQPPGAPHLPGDTHSTQTQLPPGSPDVVKPLKSPTEISDGLTQAPGSPVALADPCPPGSPSETLLSPCLPGPSAKHPEGLLLPLPGPPLSVAHVPPPDHSPEIPSCLLGISESPGSPSTLSDYCLGSDQPPGSPSHVQESLLLSRNQDSPKNHTQGFPPEDKPLHLSQLPLRRASEGVLEPRGKKAKEELGGSLAALPRGGNPPLEQIAVGESNWSLSQSFEWSFPNRTLECGGRRLGSPPRSPILEAEDTGLLEIEMGGKISSPKRSYEERSSEGLNRKEEESEAYGSSPGCRDSWSQAVGQPESPSALLQLPAPGGPSAGREASSPELKGPLMATVVGFQEENEGLLPFVPTHEEGALQAMEPMPSLEQSAPPAQPCISFSEDAQMHTAVASREDDYTLDQAQESKTDDANPLRGVEPDPNSHWLDELLASPPPSADDTKRRSMPKSDDPIGPEDLLGWSRKDLCSEFGIGETGQTSTFSMGWAEDAVSSKEEWPDETEQDREFGTGKRDWLSSYSAGDTDRQDVKFATSPQDWSGGTPLLGNSSTGQEDWLTAYGSSCADPQIRESDWSSRYSIDSAECQNTEPYVRKPGWPRLCTAAAADQESREFAMGNTDWNSQYTVSTADRTDWPSTAEPASCLESETNTKSLDVSDKCSPASHQDTQLSIGHSDIDVPYQEAAFSAQQAAWHGETNFDGSANELQIGFSAQQLEQPSECSANHPASQVNIQQHPRPDAYGFSDASCQESELSAKQSDWPTRFDLGVAQCQNSKFSVGKPDSIDVYDDSQTDWERKVGIVSRGSTPGFESGDAQFRAQKTVWPDAYILGETDPQSSNFLAGSRDWAKGTNVSGTEQKNQCSPARNNQGGSFDPLDMSDLRMTIDLVEISDSLIDQTEDLRTVAVDEPRGVGEGQSDWAQDLCLRDVSLSGVFTSENTDEPRKPTEKQLDWSSALGLARLSASSDAGLVNPELSREPGVGQADVPYGSGIGSMDVCDARSKGLDGAEEAGPVEMDWTSENQREHQDQSFCLGTTALSGGEMQHPGTSKDPRDSPSRESHSERLSSPSHLLEAMVANKAVEEVAQQKRPTSSHSCYSADEKALSSFPDEQVTATEKTRASLVSVEVKDDEKFWSNGDSGISQLDSSNCSQPPLEARQLSHLEQNGSQPARPISQEGHVTDGAEASLGETFLFLMDTEVLDSTAYRDRANLGRKRGHRAPATRSGGALSESDRDSWMFKDSTEPQVAPAVSDEEAPEEPKSRRPRNSPLSKGVKVPLFPVLNPSALKAKLRGRNRSAEEGDSQSEAKQSPAKEAHVQRSKSCKIASGKPLVLPPKPEKISGSETSSPNWLQVLKLKKKKS